MKENPSTVLIGCGEMAVSYAQVLQALGQPFDVIGRRPEACAAFAAKTGHVPAAGGIEAAVSRGGISHHSAIVAVDVESLADVTQRLIAAGVRRILVEKPGGLDLVQISATANLASSHGAEVYVAYNRRFYSSTRKVEALLAEDGGSRSLSFEFTEWSHVIEPLPTPLRVKHQWFLANSTHVCDLAFFLAGFPRTLTALTAGTLPWHPLGSIFVGCGETSTKTLFSYHSNWESAGRWGVEICTDKRRLLLRPLESVSQQLRGQLTLTALDLDDALDKKFKPGLFAQVTAFLDRDSSRLLSISEQMGHVAEVYRRMVGAAPQSA